MNILLSDLLCTLIQFPEFRLNTFSLDQIQNAFTSTSDKSKSFLITKKSLHSDFTECISIRVVQTTAVIDFFLLNCTGSLIATVASEITKEKGLLTPLKIVDKAGVFTSVNIISRRSIRLKGISFKSSVVIQSKAKKEHQFRLAV